MPDEQAILKGMISELQPYLQLNLHISKYTCVRGERNGRSGRLPRHQLALVQGLSSNSPWVMDSATLRKWNP